MAQQYDVVAGYYHSRIGSAACVRTDASNVSIGLVSDAVSRQASTIQSSLGQYCARSTRVLYRTAVWLSLTPAGRGGHREESSRGRLNMGDAAYSLSLRTKELYYTVRTTVVSLCVSDEHCCYRFYEFFSSRVWEPPALHTVHTVVSIVVPIICGIYTRSNCCRGCSSYSCIGLYRRWDDGTVTFMLRTAFLGFPIVRVGLSVYLMSLWWRRILWPFVITPL